MNGERRKHERKPILISMDGDRLQCLLWNAWVSSAVKFEDRFTKKGKMKGET